jgi:acetyl esterase
MALDPQVKAILEALDRAGFPPYHQVSPEAARRILLARRAMAAGTPEKVEKVENRTILGPAGQIPVRIYAPTGQAPLPVLVYFHGGGWVIGDLDSADGACRALANGAGCLVVSVDYRLAPEAKFPAAVDDCYAATVWTAEHAASLGGDPSRIAVGGDSCGGNLAAVVALSARDKGGPHLCYQLLICPIIDRNFETASYRDNAEGYGLLRADMEYAWRHYLRSDVDAQNPYAAPLRAKDLANLPPALIITAGYDVLRDEGEAYARRLHEAGVKVELAQHPTLGHGFFGMAAAVDEARRGVQTTCAALRAAFTHYTTA